MTDAILAFVIAAAISLYTAPLMRTAALKFGIVDRPDGRLKHQKEPVPYLGGLGIALAFLAALGAVSDFTHDLLGILLGGTILLLVGLIDDLGTLKPREKLAGQCVAVGVLLKSGIYVKLAFLPPELAIFLSVLWLLTMTNALNIIDVMDGLAGSIAFVAAIFFSAIALSSGQQGFGEIAAALAGSLVGFLRLNWAPARIYLGDSGSLFLGFTLAALAMRGQYTASNELGALTPALILGVPLFDLVFVSILRMSKGISPLRGSPDHFAIRLKRIGLAVPDVVRVTALASAALGFVAIGFTQVDSPYTAALMLAALANAGLGVGVALLRREPA